MSAAAPTCFLSMYPLTKDFLRRANDLVGGPTQLLTINDLRQHPPARMLRKLRSQRFDRVFILMEGDEGRPILPILQLIAISIPSCGVFVLDHKLVPERIGCTKVLAGGLGFVRAMAAAQLAMRRTERDLEALLSAQRAEAAARTPAHLMFLNANLWFGVKAGGSVGHISGVANGFLQAGYPLDLASAGGRFLVGEKAPLLQLQPPSSFAMPYEANLFRFNYAAADQLAPAIGKRGISLIYQRMSICNFTGVLLSRRCSVPLVMEYNGSEVWAAKNWGRALRYAELAEKAEEVSLKHAHMVVTISDVLKDELVSRGVPADRIVMYPNCIDPAVFDPKHFTADQRDALRASYDIPRDALVVTFLGTFGQWHGAPVLAEAARRLLDARPAWLEQSKMHFMWVGDGMRMEEVRSALGPHLGGPRVTFCGLVPQHRAPEYLAASDILSSPHIPNPDGSRFFGSPTKLFEYMAMDRAIIASDLDQISEVLADSIRVEGLPAPGSVPAAEPPALLARPGSVEDIVAGLEFLATRPEWRKALGANARRRALEKYTWQHHVTAILKRARDLGLVAPPAVA